MPKTADPGGPAYTVDGKGNIVPVLPAGVTQAQVDASLKANPQASKGGYEGVGTPATPGPAGQTDYGTGASTASTPSATDYSSFLGLYGLPADVQNKINLIFQQTGDVSQATVLAMAYVRGTPWYAQTYPGIQEGIARGVVGNEADYRSYLNTVNQLTQQYQGRHVGADELAGYLRNGYTPGHVGQLFQGQAYVAANRGDIQYTTGAFDSGPLSPEELTALGNENAGLDSELGQRLQNRLNLAQQRLRGVFSGSLATPGLSTANGRLQATSLGGTNPSDVGA